MSGIVAVGPDLAKSVFQVHGAEGLGRPVLRKKLRRDQVLAVFSQLTPCVVATEACGDAHFWGRAIGKLGHEARLIPPANVKPFVKRQKNDMLDAAAICEATRSRHTAIIDRQATAIVPIRKNGRLWKEHCPARWSETICLTRHTTLGQGPLEAVDRYHVRSRIEV